MYISRLYCENRDKGYLNNYERVETQPIVIRRLDSRRVPFKLYEVCTNRLNISNDDIQTPYTNSSNTTSANYHSGSYSPSTNPVAYTVLKDNVIITSGTVPLSYNYTFSIPINTLIKGYYELVITAEIDGYTYTKTFPLISS